MNVLSLFSTLGVGSGVGLGSRSVRSTLLMSSSRISDLFCGVHAATASIAACFVSAEIDALRSDVASGLSIAPLPPPFGRRRERTTQLYPFCPGLHDLDINRINLEGQP